MKCWQFPRGYFTLQSGRGTLGSGFSESHYVSCWRARWSVAPFFTMNGNPPKTAEPTASASQSESSVTEVVPQSDKPRPAVVAELRAEEVRWFYKKHPAEKLWHPLCGRDSLAIEKAYRKHQSLLKTNGPRGGSSVAPKEERIHAYKWAERAIALDDLYGLIYVPSNQGKKSNDDAKQDASLRFPYRLEPLYWEGNRLHLARGTWFLEASGGNWQPLEGSSPELVERIESLHLKKFKNQPIRATKPAPLTKVLCVVKDADEERKPGHGVDVRWYSVEDVLLYGHSRSSKLWRYLRSSSGTRIMRGYRSEARTTDGPPPVTDLIFVIHGIGQKRARIKIVKKTAVIREIAYHLLRTQFRGTAHRPVFLPVDWRTDLQLDEDVIEDLTPNFVENVRSFVNEGLMDLLYYASPVHGKKILNGLSNALNRKYQTFISHNPKFAARNGRICLAAHSLGSVISYDILCVDDVGRNLLCNPNDRISCTPRTDSETVRLAFPVHQMFFLGSPVGIFLAARHVHGTQILHPPGAASGFRLHNIYHPADAVAYRIEPLVSRIYSKVRPVEIRKIDARNPKPYDSLPNELLIRQRKVSQTRTSTATEEKSTEAGKLGTVTADPKEKHETVEIPPAQTLPYRIDFSLRPGRVVNSYHSYWVAKRAHDCYWTSREVAMYILSALYGIPKSTKK